MFSTRYVSKFNMYLLWIINITSYPLGEIRLAGGLNRCQGRLEVDRGNGYFRACNGIIDSNEARVVCQQLGCDPQGAKRSAHSEMYGYNYSYLFTIEVWRNFNDISTENLCYNLTILQQVGEANTHRP